MTTVGLLLAAGAGRRMGGPKALVRPDPAGPTLLETALGRLSAAGLERVVVVLGAAAVETLPLALSLHAEAVVADDWEEGMGASLRAGLAHLDTDPEATVDAALVTLVDLLDVRADVHRRVIAAGGDGPDALARATYDGVAGHPVLLGRHHWAEVVRTAHGDRGARDHLAAHPPRLVECGDLASGRDADTPEALHREAP
ncbi:nucleotidyltransferase family protein [Phycicoccus sp. HDW14]|uniref:nucleotidyltransferase family protein n=1 Tax=Phycicoccus sp. HDW14 TaxID=2714941 RepID=UPI0014090DCD|nr:nucleotidyltransferase family protein [Phycicoccus sp. HDW14]QIM20007.1 nucleotidyltransferase family protein [Phycicoccus sp. HDW14]